MGRREKAGRGTPAHRLWPAAGLGLLLLLVVWPASLARSIYAYSFERCGAPFDAAIVLGAAVWNDQPSPVFRERIRHGVALYQSGRVRTLVMTGGRSAGDPLAESEVARAYALERGVAVEDILWESDSRTTRDNLREARQLLDGGGSTVAIVSDPLHMRRAVTIARDLGLRACPSPTPTSRYHSWHTRLLFLIRETFYYASYLVRRPFLAG